MEWQPIETAPRDIKYGEFLGTVWKFSEGGTAICLREPFITFFSPTLNRFYTNPTHWMPLPLPPKPPVSST